MKKKGFKCDANKSRWGLLPLREIQEVVDVLTIGSEKYTDDNWKCVDNAQERYYDAMLRHISQYRSSKERPVPNLINDSETGMSHLAYVICCALFIMWFDNEHLLTSDENLTNQKSLENDEVFPEPIDTVALSERVKDLETIIDLNSTEAYHCCEMLKKQETTIRDNMNELTKLIDIQCADGNWNYDPYMYGMATGMILSKHVLDGGDGDCPYIDAPDRWLRDDDLTVTDKAIGKLVSAVNEIIMEDEEGEEITAPT